MSSASASATLDGSASSAKDGAIRPQPVSVTVEPMGTGYYPGLRRHAALLSPCAAGQVRSFLDSRSAPDTWYRTQRASTRTSLWCRCTSESRNDDLVRSLHDGDDGLALVTDLHAMRGGDEYGGQ